MPVNVVSIEDVNAFETNAVSFPIGNAGQWKTRTVEVTGGVYSESSTSNIFTFKTVNPNGNWDIERLQGSWIEDGFEVGDTISIRYNYVDTGGATTGVLSSTIISLSDLVMETDTEFASTGNATYPESSTGHNWARISTYKAIDAIEFKFNQLDNDSIDSATMNSIIDGTQAVLIAENIDATDTVTVNQMTQIGVKSGSTIINPTVKGNGVGVGVNSHLSSFIIEFTYKIGGEFDNINNYLNNEKPDVYESNNCLTNNMFVKFQSENNNPNVSIVNDPKSAVTKKIGNTGWKNENYNGLPTNITPTSIEFRENDALGDIITAPLYNNATFVTIEFEDLDATASSKYGFQFMYVPSLDSQYKNNSVSEAGNLLINSIQEHEGIALQNSGSPVLGTFQGFENIYGARMDVIDPHLVVSGTTVTLTLTLAPNSIFAQYMDSQIDGNRLVSFQISGGKVATSPINTNRTRVIIANVQMEEYLVSRGEYPFLDTRFLQHAEDENDTGTLNPFGYIQDDLKHYALIPVNKNNPFKLTGIRSEVIIEENATGSSGVLESNTFDLTNFPVTNDAQLGEIIQAISNGLRGFTLSSDNKNNWFRCNRREDLDTLNFWYLEYWYAFRLRFEDWIAVSNLPSDLFDSSLENNNYNQQWLDKILSGWTLKYKFYVEVEETTTNDITGLETTTASTFENEFPIVTVVDYEGGDMSGETITYDPDSNSLFIATDPEIYNKNLNGLINGQTDKVVFTFDSPTAISSVNDIEYAYVDLYAHKQGSIFSSWQLSTAVPNLIGGNPLQPITGTTPTVTLVDPNTVTVECNINTDLLPPSNDLLYTIGCRIQVDGVPLVDGKITEDGIQKITEDSDNKIIE